MRRGVFDESHGVSRDGGSLGEARSSVLFHEECSCVLLVWFGLAWLGLAWLVYLCVFV